MATATQAIPGTTDPIIKGDFDLPSNRATRKPAYSNGFWAAQIFLTWFAVVVLLGLCLRVHPFGVRVRRREERERRSLLDQEERSARRQQIMWDRKARNRDKFAARRGERQKDRS